MASAVDCAQSAGLLVKVPGYIVKTITPADAGPGSADSADLCGVAAAELQNASSTLRDDHYTAIKVVGGTANSGDGQAFVGAFLSGLGADARNGTVDGRTAQSFWNEHPARDADVGGYFGRPTS